jgi:hypothetical protein
MPPPPRKPVYGIPPSPVWSTPPRAATRSHPGTETSDRPPAVVPETPPVSTRQRGVSVPAWALGVIAIVTALGGVGGVKSLVESVNAEKPATALQQDATNERLSRLEAKQDARDAKERHWRERQERRWEIVVDWGCRMNGVKGPEQFARGQDCSSVIWDPPPLGSSVPWTAREEWPKP